MINSNGICCSHEIKLIHLGKQCIIVIANLFNMETYGKILLIAMPAFLLLVLFEKWYGWKKGFETVNTLDMISSLSSGVTNSTKDVLGLSIVILSYGWFVDHLAIMHVQNSIWLYVIAFISLDFAGYWVHRLAHSYNFSGTIILCTIAVRSIIWPAL